MTNCNAILAGGAFDTFIDFSTSTANEQMTEWLSEVTWQEFSEQQDAGLGVTLPIEGIPIGLDGKYTQEQFEQFVQQRQSGMMRNYSVQDMFLTIKRTASETLANAWLQCVQNNPNPVGLTCWVEDDHQPSGVVIFNARYFPDSPDNITEPIISEGGLTVADGVVIDAVPSLVAGAKVTLGGVSVAIRRQDRKGMTIRLQTSKGARSVRVDPLPVPEPPPPAQIRTTTRTVTSNVTAYPTATASLPPGYKVIGGGALANWRQHGSLLIASYPSGNSWVAQSKDHGVSEPCSITVWAIGLYDPEDKWQVEVVETPYNCPTGTAGNGTATLSDGYVMTCGGFRTSPPGILVSSSRPDGASTWRADARDHSTPVSGTLFVYAIGIRPRTGAPPESAQWQSTSGPAAHPSHAVGSQPGWIITGGGASTGQGSYNMLTATYPQRRDLWRGESKDHIGVTDVRAITVYAIGLKNTPGSVHIPSGFAWAGGPDQGTPTFNGVHALVVGHIAPRTEDRVGEIPVAKELFYCTHSNDTLRDIALRFANGRVSDVLAANTHLNTDAFQSLPAGVEIRVPVA